MVRRSWWIVLVSVLAGLFAAGLFTALEAKEYQASTEVLVQPIGTDSNAVGGRTRGDINLDTEAQVVQSSAVATKARDLMRSAASPDSLRRHVSVEVPPNSTVLLVGYRDRTAAGARAGSHAFAEAYLRNREDTAKADLTNQTKALQAQILDITNQLQQLTGRQAALPTNSPDRAFLDTQKANLSNQLNTLTLRLNTLNTTTVDPGEIISDAQLPAGPIRPIPLINLVSGLVVGLVVGVAIAVGRDRLDGRVRRGLDVERRCDVPVLVELPSRIDGRLDDVFPTFGQAGQLFGRLRNEVVASLHDDQKVIVISGASRGPASRLVAANLAVAFARSGDNVVLVSAQIDAAAPLTRMLGVPATPGLSEVLTKRAPLTEVLHRAARHPGLRVVSSGAAANASGLYRVDAVRGLIEQLRREADYVLIETPATSVGADAQSLAVLADAALLAVELRRTRHSEVADGAEQLRRVDATLLGAVVVPRLTVRPEHGGAAGTVSSGAGGAAGTVPSAARGADVTQPITVDADPARLAGGSVHAAELAGADGEPVPARPAGRRGRIGGVGRSGNGDLAPDDSPTVVLRKLDVGSRDIGSRDIGSRDEVHAHGKEREGTAP